MHVNSNHLVDTRTDKSVVSHNLVKKLNMKVKHTSTQAKDAGGCLLPIIGEVILIFSCHYRRHKGKTIIKQTALVLEHLREDCLIPFDVSIKLNLLTFNNTIYDK